MSDDDQLLMLLAVAWVASKYNFGVVPALQRKGAELYEVVHPEQKNHADDLPGKRLTRAQLVALATRVGFKDTNTAVAIALAESGGYPGILANESRGGQSVGLWQIYLRAHPQYSKEQMRDPIQNARAAFKISKGGTNWQPWSTYKTGAYKRHMQ